MENPDSEVVGVDLKPAAPPNMPSNCQIIKTDVFDQLKFGTDFDLIYARALGTFTMRTELFQLVFDNLAPGGWVEFQEWDGGVQSADHSTDGTALEKWDRTLKKGKHPHYNGNHTWIRQLT